MRCVLPRFRIRHDRSPRQTPDVGTGPFDGGHHVVAGFGDLARWAWPPACARRTRGQLPGGHSPQGVTGLGVVYLLVRAVHAHAQHLEQNASSVRNVVPPGSGKPDLRLASGRLARYVDRQGKRSSLMPTLPTPSPRPPTRRRIQIRRHEDGPRPQPRRRGR
jgi:hypothetical protein